MKHQISKCEIANLETRDFYYMKHQISKWKIAPPLKYKKNLIMPYCVSIADRRLNSSIKIRCLFLHFLSLAQDAPHPLHKAIVVFTPTPHPVHGIIPPPLSTKGLWKLQYSPMQLLPHISAFPISSHAQMFLPLILLLLYSDTPIIQMEIFFINSMVANFGENNFSPLVRVC